MLITNATLVTWGENNQILPNHALRIEGDRIAEIGTTAELRAKYPDSIYLDAKGQLVMPGNICAHTHFYGAYARGMAIPGDPPKDFPEILERLCASTAHSRSSFQKCRVTQLSITNSQFTHDRRSQNILRAAQQRATPE